MTDLLKIDELLNGRDVLLICSGLYVKSETLSAVLKWSLSSENIWGEVCAQVENRNALSQHPH
jgi:hypothetical protein